MNEIVLSGCTPTVLAGYLKALGIFRLISEQTDSTVRGCWEKGYFILIGRMTKNDLCKFFLDVYRPTPIISPWNGRAGFLEGDEGEQSTRKGAIIIRRISDSSGNRFELYRSVIAEIKNLPVVNRLDIVRSEIKSLEKEKVLKNIVTEERLKVAKKEERNLKNQLLSSLRGSLPDEFLPWLDACVILAGDEKFLSAPLLGSGGNEGSMDYSVNHIELLLKLICPDSDKPLPLAVDILSNAIFGDSQAISSRSNPGFLSPHSVGGPNMSTGYTGLVSENPWNTVLMLEGALFFAATATKRLESNDLAGLSFPFMVESLRAGHGSIGSSESARPELWAPIWGIPASTRELYALLAEGRSTLGRRQVRDGLDMARAISSLGVNKGISTFARYGFFERRGQGYYIASCLGEFRVSNDLHDDWTIRDLDQNDWLNLFRRFAQGDNVAKRFLTLRRQLEDALFDLSNRAPIPAEVQALLILLGEIQVALSNSRKAQESSVQPIPRLSERWVQAADDGTPAFRIARALAGLSGTKDTPLPLRAQLFPIHPKYNTWMKVARKTKGIASDPACRLRIHTETKGNLPNTLISLLGRRLWLAEQLEIPDKPLRSRSGVDLDDLVAFLRNNRMDHRIAALLPGLSLCSVPQDIEHTAGEGAVPAAFALLKLCLTPDAILRKLELLGERDHIHVPPGLLAQLVAGNTGNRAVRLVWRRLHASGLSSLFVSDTLPEIGDIDPRRAAAALLIPLRLGASGVLARSILKIPKIEAN